MKVFEGKAGISARILADSVSSVDGTRLRTFEITCPRIVLAEENTHRMLSKNSASSRAIPFAKMKEQLTGRPVRFGQANPGMQDKGEDFDAVVIDPQTGGHVSAEDAWRLARLDATAWSEAFYDAGYHKQIYNRLTEPFQQMKTVITGTEFNNFFWLRDHGAADPTIAELARVMREASEVSEPIELRPGEWHLPYVGTEHRGGALGYFIENGESGEPLWIDVEAARKISAARSAAVSFRNTDYGYIKCMEVFDRLVGDERKHASAFEHCCTPMARTEMTYSDFVNWEWEPGVSHMDKDGKLWSGNLKGWVQFRKLIPGEAVWG